MAKKKEDGTVTEEVVLETPAAETTSVGEAEVLGLGRVLGIGTKLTLGGVEVSLQQPALVQFDGWESDNKFAGMLTANLENFVINKSQFKFKRNSMTGAILPLSDQGLKNREIEAFTNEERELFNLPLLPVVEEDEKE